MRTTSPSAGTLDGTTVQQPAFLLAPGMVVLAVVLQTSTRLTPFLRFDEQRVIELVVLVALAVASITLPVLRASILEFLDDARRVVLAVLAVMGVGAVSAAAAAEPWQALLDMALQLLLAWLVVMVAASVRQQPRDTSTFLLLGLVLAMAIYSLGFLALPDLTPRGQGLWNRSSWGGFSNPRFLGDFVVFCVPLAVAVSSSTRLPRAIRVLAALVAASGWWAMVLTGGRAPLVAWTVGAAVAVLVVGRGEAARRFLFRQGAVGVVGIAAGVATRIGLILIAGGDLTFGAVVNRDLTTSAGRVALWDHSLDLVAENPVLGVGPGHFAHVEHLMTPTASAHPHSLPLQYLSEWGIPVTVVLLVLGVAGVARLHRAAPADVDLPEVGTDSMLLRLAVTTSVASGLAASLVSGVGVTPTGQLLLATTLGWLVGLVARRSTRPGRHRPRAASAATVILVVAALLPITATLVTTTPSDRLDNTLRVLEHNDTTVVHPRFWQQGVIGLEKP